MTPSFAVFNLHCNDAGKRADELFREKYGTERFNKVIKPLHEAGIMSIFHKRPNCYTKYWVAQVTAIVNGMDLAEVKREYFTKPKETTMDSAGRS